MGYQRIMAAVTLGLATAILLSSGTASATTLTSPTGTVATPTIKAESEGHVVLDNPIAKIECAVSLEGSVEDHGAGKAASGEVSSMSFTNCTDDWHITVVSAGTLSISHTSGYNGDVVSSGATIEATRFGITCRYITNNTTIGTLTGGTPATIDISASIPFHSGSFFCGSGATTWTGSFKVSSPSALYVDEKIVIPDTTITSPTGTVATPTIKGESEGHVALDHPIAKIQCQWAFEGSVKTHGVEEAELPLTSLTTTGCTEEWHATTVTPGKLEIAWTSGYNGKVTWTGGTIEMTRLGTTCRYKSENTQIGTLTGGSPATIDIEGELPFHSGSPLCGTEAYSLTGSLKLTSPGSLYIDEKVEVPGTSLTSPTGTVATPTIKAESEGHVVLDNPIAKIECASTVEGKVESHGSGTSASGKVSAMSFSECTDDWHITVVAAGNLSIQHTSGYNAEVYSNGVTVESTRFGIGCRYSTNGTTIGTLTGGTPATIDISASIPFHSGSVFCGSGATPWTGSYKVTSPSALYVDAA